jgi:hypothetical protein
VATYILFRNVGTPFFKTETIIPPTPDGPVPPLVIGPQQTFQFTVNSPNSVALSATTQVVVSNDGINWATNGSPVTVTGTKSATTGFSSVGNWKYFAAYLTAISGLGALATLIMDEGPGNVQGGGGGAIINSSAALTLGAFGNYSFVGTVPVTWTAPQIGLGLGPYTVKNRGSAVLTLVPTGANQFYYSSPVSTFYIFPGSSFTILDDGTYWSIE